MGIFFFIEDPLAKHRIICVIALFCSNVANAQKVKTIVDLQPLRTDTILDITTKDANRAGFVRLVNLNPNVNTWFLLDVTWPGDRTSKKFHLENPEPRDRLVFLDKKHPNGLRIVTKGTDFVCDLWAPEQNSELKDIDIDKKTYGSICGGRLFIRNQLPGNESTKEWMTDFLRSHVWGGEEITTLVKDYLYKDKFLLTADVDANSGGAATKDPTAARASAPQAALLAKEVSGATIFAKEMGIAVHDGAIETMRAGSWYESKARKGVFISVMEAKLAAPEILGSHKNLVQKLDPIEAEAVTYLVAYDLNRYDLGFALGTLHPSAEWSARTPDKIRKKSPGPDGIGDFLPLQMTGKVNPNLTPRVISTFTAGFKRTHGAFKWGKLSQVNAASHYGFIESGVVFSKLQPDLATVFILNDGRVELKTWTTADDKLLPGIKHARQNGVAIIDYDPVKDEGVPGTLVSNWTAGNWSGSVDSKQRALRAGICMQEHRGQRFLIYGYFSSVTPNAMARTFQAYGCKYAFHLDMNALEHTYLALYQSNNKKFDIEHLITGMNVLDRKSKDQVVPRFVGTADNRDFFYVIEK